MKILEVTEYDPNLKQHAIISRLILYNGEYFYRSTDEYGDSWWVRSYEKDVLDLDFKFKEKLESIYQRLIKLKRI